MCRRVGLVRAVPFNFQRVFHVYLSCNCTIAHPLLVASQLVDIPTAGGVGKMRHDLSFLFKVQLHF